MKSKRVYSDYLRDILEACQKAIQFVEGMSYETFSNDDKTQYAVVRALTGLERPVKRSPSPFKIDFPMFRGN